MVPTVLRDKASNDRGLTLIELMVAMVVLLFVSLALMQTALLSIDANMRNVIRDEAVRVADAKMDELRNTAFGNLPAGMNLIPNYNAVSARTLRNLDMDYVINTTIENLDGTDLTASTKKVDVDVYWNWKGEGYSMGVSSIRRSGK
jgi:prepilin-type N-terminal cleavage/methylation domain-containing protein